LGQRKKRNFGKYLARAGRAILHELAIDAGRLIPAGRLFFNSRGFDHAAAISFYFILSLAPFVILVVSAMGYMAARMGAHSVAMDQLLERLSASIGTYVPVQSDTLRSVVEYLVSRKGSFGIAGTGVLILGASAIFGAIENATADIFRNGQRRKYIVSRLVFTVALATAGLLVFMLYNSVTILKSFLEARLGTSVIEGLMNSAAFKFLFEWLPVPVGFLIVLYVPGIARPRFVDGVRAAILYFLLWTLVRAAYAHYVTEFANYNMLYGSLAAPILLVLWLFYSALLLIYCLCFAAVAGGPQPAKRARTTMAIRQSDLFGE
jgi:membrane protein